MNDTIRRHTKDFVEKHRALSEARQAYEASKAELSYWMQAHKMNEVYYDDYVISWDGKELRVRLMID